LRSSFASALDGSGDDYLDSIMHRIVPRTAGPAARMERSVIRGRWRCEFQIALRDLSRCAKQIERRIATATPPNRLTTQRRLLQRAGTMHMGAAMMRVGSNLHPTAGLSGLTLRFHGIVRSVGPAEKGRRVDIRGAKNLHQGRS
jgi:hypothetical protein